MPWKKGRNLDNKEEVKKFIKENKLTARETEDHFQLDCFLCTDTKERLGIHIATGAWKCFNCQSCGKKINSLEYAFKHKGKFKTKDQIEKTEKEEKCTIKPDLHKKFHKDIYKTKSTNAAKYLVKERGITKDAIKHFELGTRSLFKAKDKNTGEVSSYDAGEHLSIPYISDGKCVNVKYRRLDPEGDKKFKWRREKGGVTALYNDTVIDDLDYREIYITESELDCISLWVLGIKNVIGLTAGAEGFKQSWYDRLERFEKIYLVLDNDKPGQIGAKKLARRLGMGRCWNIILPEEIKDPNDLLLKYDLNKFKSIRSKAKQFDVEDAVSLRSAMETIYNQRFVEGNEDVIGFDTQYKRLNHILGPLKPGYFVVISAKPKVGKTTLVLNWMRYWAKKGINVGMYQVEMRPERLAEKFTLMEIPDIPKIEEATPSMIYEAKYKLPIDKMHFYYPKPNDLEIEKVCTKIREMVQRYGIKIFCFDNLHFLCRGENENALIDMATRAFKLLAEELDIVFILVTHPKKTGNNKQLKNEDMKGSSSIYQDADAIILANRKDIDGDFTPDELEQQQKGMDSSSKSLQCDLKVTSRWHSGGMTYLAFHENRAIFSEKGILFSEITKELKKGKRKPKRGL